MNAYELYLDGKQIVKSNSIHGSNYQYAAVHLEAGKLYAIRLDFHEFVNDAAIQLVWSRPARADDQRGARRRDRDAGQRAAGLVGHLTADVRVADRLRGDERRRKE
jgi:hypothetical protein